MKLISLLMNLLSMSLTVLSGQSLVRIDFVVPSDQQPHSSDKAVIWYDDFDDPAFQSRYAEGGGELTDKPNLGLTGKSLRMYYEKGKRGIGGRKVFFGDTPTYGNKAVRRGEHFTDIYWRIYVKHQAGWTGGGPAKLSRATSIVPPGWRQAMIAHVWSSGESLTLDPATGVRGGQIVTERYNDFKNLKWLGNKPASKFKIHSTEESGRWVCVESRARLNTPGKSDGLNQLWIDGRLEAERRNLNWRGTYTEHGINAVFLEAYWNKGSPADQSRWLDLFVISTKPIGPVVCPVNPVLSRTPYTGNGKENGWEAEIAADSEGKNVVWKSRLIESTTVKVDGENGSFVGSRSGKQRLAIGSLYLGRSRQNVDGKWSVWSSWHQPFRTEMR